MPRTLRSPTSTTGMVKSGRTGEIDIATVAALRRHLLAPPACGTVVEARLVLAVPDPSTAKILQAARVHLTVPIASCVDKARGLLAVRPPRVVRSYELPYTPTAYPHRVGLDPPSPGGQRSELVRPAGDAREPGIAVAESCLAPRDEALLVNAATRPTATGQAQLSPHRGRTRVARRPRPAGSCRASSRTPVRRTRRYTAPCRPSAGWSANRTLPRPRR